jgi:UrcA family protein
VPDGQAATIHRVKNHLRDTPPAGVLPQDVAVRQFLQTNCARAASNVLNRNDQSYGFAVAYSISGSAYSITGDTIMTKSAIIGGAFIAALSLSAPQFVMAEEPIVQSITVSFADLDPSNAAGARLLYARIRWAARKVCTLDGETGHVAQSWERAQCVQRAVDQAVMTVNNPVLVAMYRGKNRQTGT